MSVNHLGPSSSTRVGGGINPGCGGPCGACKFQRRKCVPGCVFMPHFQSEQGSAHFAAVHKVFGASNVSKLLSSIPLHKRQDSILTVCYEAQARVCDPVHGCVAHILALQKQVMSLQDELSYLQAHATTIAKQPICPPQPTATHPPDQIMSTVPTANLPSVIYIHQHQPHGLSPLFDPKSQQASWAEAMQNVIDPRQSVGLPSSIRNLEVLECELIREQADYTPGYASSSPTVSKKE